MATIEVTSQASTLSGDGDRTSGILHLDPTPVYGGGSGEAIVYSKENVINSGDPTTGMILVELPSSIPDGIGLITITLTGYNYLISDDGGGAWSLVIGGYAYGGPAGPAWYHPSAYFIGSIPSNLVGMTNVQLLIKGEDQTSAFAIALGTSTTGLYNGSLQIKVQAGANTSYSTLAGDWPVTYGVADYTALGWTLDTSMIAKRPLTSSGDTMTGVLNMSGNRIVSVGSAVNAADVVVKSQLDATKMRRGALVVNSLNAGATFTVPNIARLNSMDSVINVVNRSGVTGYSWAVVYDSDTLLTIYIKNMNAIATDFGTFHFYQAAL